MFENIRYFLYKVAMLILGVMLAIPSLIYIIKNKTVMEFNTYFNFFINTQSNKIISTVIYLLLFIAIIIFYMFIIKKQKELFKDIKKVLKYVAIISIIFAIMLPWTSSDVFYYMGVGELDSRYFQNPYYITVKEYYEQNKENINDEILEKGANNVWAKTTVVYGPIAQLIFKICTLISFKNVDICLIVFKVVNVLIHLANCYLIYKLSNKNFAVIYGLNPFILLEFIANVHNDIIVIFFVLLALYFLKHEKLVLSILFLALATGVKYFTILLVPVVIIYYYRNEKKLGIRFLNCLKYGILFLIILMLEYILYFKDFQVITAMFAQTDKYSKSIYSVLIQENKKIMTIVKYIATLSFLAYYLKFCIDLITEKNIKLYKVLKKYNIALILFLLILTNFQQWYLGWLFATILWQNPNMIRNIIGLTVITEIANSIYMIKAESYIYDIYFVGIIICLFIIWQIFSNKPKIYNKDRRTLNWIN